MECFTVYTEEIEGAINPERYRNILKFENQTKIKDFATVVNESFIPAKKYPDKTFDWLRIDNVHEGGILSEDSIIKTKGEKINKSSVQFAKEGDILIARLGPSLSNEKILVAPKTNNELVVSNEFIVLRTKDISPEIVVYILRTNKYLKYVLSKGRGGTPSRLRIDRNDFLELNFPKLDKRLLTRIFGLVDGLKSSIKTKEAEAQRLLDSINDYVLGELGIKLPELKDKMCYAVNSDEVQNKRADAYYYQPKFEEVEKAIKKGRFEVKTLKQLKGLLINGFDYRDFTEDGVKYLRVSNIRPNRFDLEDIVFVPKMEIKKDINLKKGDVLLTRKGTYGMAAVVEKESEKYFISSEIFRITLKKELDPLYISTWLNSNIQKIIFKRIKTGGIMGHLSQEALLDIKIPTPPLSIQNKIAEEVKSRMRKAEQLQKEAKEDLEEAKKEVEKIILGEG